MSDSAIYRYIPHHRTKAKLTGEAPGPVKATDQLQHGNAAARFNAWFAVKVTTGVGTMWCAYAFAVLALISLPSAISSGSPVVLVSWISQTFLQLVLLSVIIVGQNVLAAAADKRAEATYSDADAVLHEADKLTRSDAWPRQRSWATRRARAACRAIIRPSPASSLGRSTY